RQTCDAGSTASGGQNFEVPSQNSSTSQTSPGVAPRQRVPDGCTASAGQVGLVPSHVSSTSQTSAGVAARHVTPALPALWVQVPLPSPSSTVQVSPSLVHAVPDGSKLFGGQVVEVPSQSSATSQSPASGRQTAPALPAGCWQAALVPSH